MEKAPHVKSFCENVNWMPDSLKNGIGQFNVFNMSDNSGNMDCMSYSRRDFYKISLINGHTKFYYADKSVEFEKSALLFANPQIPYSWEVKSESPTGFFCIFTETFFSQLSHIETYPVFKPGDNPIFELPEDRVAEVSGIYLKMMEEINADFTYKYDVLRNLVLELIYTALKMQPATSYQYNNSNASMRVASLFTELLERQFPIESVTQSMKLRSPTEFALQLSVHVNHLNRSLKEVTGKTTSQLIRERVIREAKALLMHTDWNISEIAWCLGFEELPHFINYFKKDALLTPKVFRQNQFV